MKGKRIKSEKVTLFHCTLLVSNFGYSEKGQCFQLSYRFCRFNDYATLPTILENIEYVSQKSCQNSGIIFVQKPLELFFQTDH